MHDKYLQYEIEEFLTDDAFVNWVLQNKDQDLWENWLKNNTSFNEQIMEARKLVLSIQFESHSIDVGRKAQLWERIDSSTQAREISIQKINRRRIVFSIAVAAIVALFFFFILPDNRESFDNNARIAQLLTLPSNSEVTVLPASKISYRKRNWSQSRVVDLEGQAHFKISKGVPFRVQTQNGEVQVLGTEFDVVSTQNTFYVKVDEGRVNATTGNFEEILTKGMAMYMNPLWSGGYAIDEGWQTDEVIFAFKERPLSEALRALQFFYDLDIDLNQVNAEIAYTGSFDSKEGIQSSLQNVLWPLNITFELSQNQLMLNPDN